MGPRLRGDDRDDTPSPALNDQVRQILPFEIVLFDQS